MADLLAQRNEKKRENGNFLSGVFILSLSAVIVKIIGLVYKIPMLKLLGSEGMGYFNSAYEIYALFCVISTAGLPVAMSVMISSSVGKGGMAQRIFKVAMRLFLIVGFLGTALMLVSAHTIADFLKSDKAFYCIAAISPTVLLICVSSAYRGYFQGLGRMFPTAISQIIEALGKLLVGLLLAAVAFDMGFPTEIVAAFAAMGLTLGVSVSVLYLALSKKFSHVAESEPIGIDQKDGIAKGLMKIAVPITLSSAVISLTKVIDMTMILRRMQSSGVPADQAFSVYGSYTTLAVPLFSLAPALISSVSLPLVPTLSAAIAAKDTDAQRKAVGDAVRLTCIVSMPISAGLCLFSKQILNVIFAGESEAISLTAPLLSLLALSVTLSCLVTVGNAVLQSYGKASIPMWSMAVGAAVKIALAYILIGNQSIGIAGAPVSTFFCDLTINIVNFYHISRQLPSPVSVGKTVFSPFLASAVSVTVARLVLMVGESRWGESMLVSVIAIAVAAALYLPLCLLLGVMEREDVKKIIRKERSDKVTVSCIEE